MRSLPPVRWQQIDRLFDAAMERPPAEREAFVRQACAGDTELYREVKVLLDSSAEAEAALGESGTRFAALFSAALQDEPAADALGARPAEARVGPYRLLEEIGRGGNGA